MEKECYVEEVQPYREMDNTPVIKDNTIILVLFVLPEISHYVKVHVIIKKYLRRPLFHFQ